MRRNYSLYTEKIIGEPEPSGKRRSLLLHACCAPCSSYVLEYLTEHFDITVLFYNPNITDSAEFDRRKDEILKLIRLQPHVGKVVPVVVKSEKNEFFDAVKGLENEPEGGRRCIKCYEMRLEAAARYAKENGFDYFTTTLSISPHKDAEALNEIGSALGDKYNVKYLFSDFKKKNGYLRSIELSKKYSLYRQDFCGCVFSLAEAKKRRKDKTV